MNQGFEVARNIGNNLAAGFRESKDQSAIDSILSQAMDTEDPAVLQQSIGRILSQVSPERQQPAIQFITQRVEGIKQQKQNMQTQKAYESQGFAPSMQHLPPALQAQISKNQYNQRQADTIFGGNTGQNGGVFGQNAAQNAEMPQIPPRQPQNQQGQQRTIRDLSDNELTSLLSNPAYSKAAQQVLTERSEDKKIKNKADTERDKRFGKRNDEILKKVDQDSAALPQQRATLDLMTNSIANRDMSFWTADNLAEQTGLDVFRSPESAIFKSQSKQYFLGDLERIKGRANQFIEKQIVNAQAKVGQSTGANLSILRAEQNKLDLKEKEIEVVNGIIDEFRESGKEPHNLAKLINDKMTPYAIEKEKEMHNDFAAINTIEDNRKDAFVPVKKGTIASDYVIMALLKRHGGNVTTVERELEKLGYAE